jgi:soluble lytic murein transglycosylase-like protein
MPDGSASTHSIIRAESNYDSRAISPKGAVGLMQLMPATAAQYGVEDRFDPDENIRGGVKYLKDLIKLFNGNTAKVLAAYNAGQEALKKFNGIPPYAETVEYIRRVMASYSHPFIRGGVPIRKFVDGSGLHVFTNDPYYHLNSRKNRD